jgi:hypothetical protein
MLDLGKIDSASIKAAKWDPVSVANSEFVLNEAKGCSLLPDSNEVLIFGG